MSEAERLASLHSFDVLDTAPEAAFDRLTALAAQLFDAPIALVSLIDAERQWFKSRHGLEVAEIPREAGLCADAVQQAPGAVVIVEDASCDPRFQNHPLVAGGPAIRFYAGAVLTSADGLNLGALCIMDPRRRPPLTKRERGQLRELARMAEDALELRRTARRAEARQRQLELAEHMAALGHWRLDLATQTMEWSNELYRIHGLARGDFTPTLDGVLPLYDDEGQARIRRGLDQVAAGRGAFAFDLTIIRPDGLRREVTCKAVVERDDAGAPRTLIGVFQDITAARAAERALAASEARYRLLADHASDMILQCDLSGRVLYVSPSVTTTTGWTPAELVGRPALGLVHPDDFARVSAAVAGQADGRGGAEAARLEHRVVCKDRRELWLEATPRLALDPLTGRTTGFTVVIRDITGRKALEANLRDARAEAERAAATRSELLANIVAGPTRLGLDAVRVLVADHQAPSRELAKVCLQAAGCEVFEAHDKAEAAAAAATQPFDVILVARRMPGMDGPQTVDKIRHAAGLNAQTPILALSANAGGAADDAFDGFVAKPISADALIAEVARVMERVSAPEGARKAG